MMKVEQPSNQIDEIKKRVEDLKPCPFCGGESNIIKRSPVYDGGFAVPPKALYVVECEDCLSKSSNYLEKDKAIAAWNLRSPSQLKRWTAEDGEPPDGLFMTGVGAAAMVFLIKGGTPFLPEPDTSGHYESGLSDVFRLWPYIYGPIEFEKGEEA